MTEETTLERLVRLQEGCCYLCNMPFADFSYQLAPTIDHVRPRAAGGKNLNNVLAAHRCCNELKADRMPEPDELAYLEWLNGLEKVERVFETMAERNARKIEEYKAWIASNTAKMQAECEA